MSLASTHTSFAAGLRVPDGHRGLRATNSPRTYLSFIAASQTIMREAFVIDIDENQARAIPTRHAYAYPR